MLFNLSEQNTLANQYLAELRDINIQQDRMRFRRNIERLGEIMAYEISRKFSYRASTVETPLGKSVIQQMQSQPVLIGVLRAGLPYLQGFINFFDYADAGFVGAYRQEGEDELTIKLDYVSTPDLTGRHVVLIDPMLATGRSIVDSLQLLLMKGRPAHLHIASLIAAPEGIQHIREKVAVPYTLWTWAVDEKLDHRFYIVPGLGDAGDLSYGPKL